jgi:5'-deoxynucleotidase YfbR-like HD superfamily hydrolase
LWIEFEARETIEAKTLFQLDKLDAAIQALEYEKIGHSSVTDFYPDTLQKIFDPILKKIFEILLCREFTHVSFYEQYFLLLQLN